VLNGSSLIAFVGVADLARARTFYEQVLGLEIVSVDQFAIAAKISGTILRITKVPAVTAAAYTVLGFAVADIEAKTDALVAQGVVLERFAFLGEAQDAKGIWTSPSGARVAWFKDRDGNLLSISEH
jgi:catechol 2,3-dioxygenase-like lactoylglutathione lyase family enzyme